MSHEGVNFGVGGGGVGGAEGGGLGSVSSSLGEVGNCRVSSLQKLGPWGFYGLSTGLAGEEQEEDMELKEVVGFGVFVCMRVCVDSVCKMKTGWEFLQNLAPCSDCKDRSK